MDDDRQLRELHLREQLEQTIQKMERDVKRGNALQRLLRAERLAANRDTDERELNNVTHSER